MLKATIELETEYPEHEGAMLPTQMRPAVSPRHARSGERLLMLALLADAVNIFLKNAGERRLKAETRQWIRGADSAYQAVSFEDACDALGIDPDALRQRLFRLKYGGQRSDPAHPHHASLMLKPPVISRGPVKVGVRQTSRPVRQRRVTS